MGRGSRDLDVSEDLKLSVQGGMGLPLTRRQAQVIALVAAGLSSGEIGRCLGISSRTVDRHIDLAMTLLDANSRAHLVALCYWGGTLAHDSWPPTFVIL